MQGLLRDRPIQTIIFLLFFIASIGLVFFRSGHKTAVIQIGEKKAYVQIAKTIEQQRKGLGGRESMGEYAGMAFPVLPAKQQGIVMRNMKFPIDIVWVLDGYVIDIAAHASPEPGVNEDELMVYYPRTESNLIIELEAGFTEKYGITIGDRVFVVDE